MPDKPLWSGHLANAVAELRTLPDRWVDRETLERVLRVSRRRAQQLLAPCACRQIGSSVVADREELILHLERLASGEAAFYERQRRQRLAGTLRQLERNWTEEPRMLVEAPVTIVNQAIANLPPGVQLAPGRITVEFFSATEALQKLLAIAMAAGNDLAGFERAVNHTPAR